MILIMIKIQLALLLHLCRICAGGRNDVAHHHHQHYSPAVLDPYPEVNGYYLDVSYNHDHNVELQQMEASGPEILECPSNNVITTRYRCQVDDEWTDCTKSRCCPGFTFVAGRCIPDDINPCSLNLCEQKCSVYFGRVICTCFVGYKFNPENHRKAAESNQMQGGGSVCEDIDECQDNHGDCSQVCINTPGSYHCGCRDGFFLHPDNQTCIRPTTHQPAFRDDDEQTLLQQIPDPTGHDRAGQCNANCNTVNKLKRTVDSLTEKVRSLVTAIKLYSFAIGPPGPPGPPGPAGPAGPRGFPGTGALASSIGMADFGEHLALGSPGDDDEEDVMLEEAQDAFDSFKIVKKKGKRHFCKCKRGPIGHTGAPGIQGPRGPKGEAGPQGPKGNAGSFDFLMLMVADLRHDLKQLQDKVFPDKEREPLPPRYNLKQQLTWDQDYPVRPAAVAAASRPSHTTDTESEDSG